MDRLKDEVENGNSGLGLSSLEILMKMLKYFLTQQQLVKKEEIREADIDNVKKMKLKNIDINIISEITGLIINEIETL